MTPQVVSASSTDMQIWMTLVLALQLLRRW